VLLLALAGVRPVGAEPDAFGRSLASGTLEQLADLCPQALQDPDPSRLARLRARLYQLLPAPQPLGPLIANAEALRRCQAPLLGLKVLDRLSPAPGPDRQIWLVEQWRLAADALDHQRCVLALERLAEGSWARLAAIPLPVAPGTSGQRLRWSALEALADHLEALGQPARAAAVLLAVPAPGLAGAERLQTAARLLQQADGSSAGQRRQQLREQALQLAAAAGAWGLVAELLDEQIRDPGAPAAAVRQARQRRLRLSPRLDDAYGEGLWRRDTSGDPRRPGLEQTLAPPQPPSANPPSSISPSPQP